MFSRNSLFVITLIGCLLFALTTPAFAGEHRGECAICGMWIDRYMSTRHVITLKDNTTKSFCSIACAAKYLKEHEGEIKDVKVADFPTQKLSDAERAYYLEGSDVPGVMSHTGRIAFAAKDNAERFQKKHGGRIMTFKQAVENQLKGD